MLLPVLLTAATAAVKAASTSNGGGCGVFASANAENQQPALVRDSSGTSFTFGTSQFALTFNTTTLDLLNVTACSADGWRQHDFLWKGSVVERPGGPQPGRSRFSLWMLTYSDCSRSAPWPAGGHELDGFANASAGRNFSVTVAPDGAHVLALRWQGMVPGHRLTASARRGDVDGADSSSLDVTVQITMRSGSGQASMRGSVVAHGSSPICLQNMVLPNFNRLVLRSPDQDVMFTPFFFGQIGDQSTLCGGGDCTLELTKTGFGGHGEFALMPNGNQRSMQFAALYSHTSTTSPPPPSPLGAAATTMPLPLGLYIGAHSPNADLMSLTMQGAYCPPAPPPNSRTGCGSYAGARWYHFPSNSLTPIIDGDEWSMPYDVVLAGFEGDWFDAAMIYRHWALGEASWTKAGNLSTRVRTDPSYPHWLLEAPLWTQVSSTNTSASWVEDNIQLAAALGTPIGTHWYEWDKEAFDTHYPVYTPRPGFSFATAKMQAATPAVHVIPYTNGRLFDPRDPKYSTDHAQTAACYRPTPSGVTPKRQPYTEAYHPVNWRFVVMDPATEYWQSTIANVVSAIVAAGNTSGVYIDQIASFYAESCCNDTHTGGASRWADGNRAVLDQAVKAVGPGRMIISESNAEAYLGSLHAYLALYGWWECGFVPAFQSVYGGWSVNVGSSSWPTDVQGVRIALALQWTYGHVMGWANPPVFLANHETLKFTRLLAQLKVNHSAHLVFGRLMRPPTLTTTSGGALRELTWCTTWHRQTCCPTAQVLAQLWMDGQGGLGLAMANPTNETVSVTAAVRVDGHTQLVAGGRALVDGVPARVGETHLLLNKTLTPLSACLVLVMA